MSSKTTIKRAEVRKNIVHLAATGDYTLCGYGVEEIANDGVPNAGGASIETYEDIIAKRNKYNSNCRLCQEAVENVLSQIKRKILLLPKGKKV